MAGFPRTKLGNKALGEKAKRPKPGIPLDKSVVSDLIIKLNGNISRIADSLGSTRNTVRNFINRDAELQDMLEESRERVLDELEDNVWQDAIENRDTAMRIFLLRTRGKHRGYEQDDSKSVSDIAREAFEYVVNRSKNPAEHA